MQDNKKAGKIGGNIAKKARIELEEKTGKKVVSSENYLGRIEEVKNIKLRN